MKLFHINHRDLLSVEKIHRVVRPVKIAQLNKSIKEISYYSIDMIGNTQSKWNLNRIQNKNLIYDEIMSKLNEKIS